MGGEVILVDIAPGHSTTRLVERSRAPAKSAAEEPMKIPVKRSSPGSAKGRTSKRRKDR
jgi:hypothetical protein